MTINIPSAANGSNDKYHHISASRDRNCSDPRASHYQIFGMKWLRTDSALLTGVPA
jgi:hypothetical protein